ncbi:lipid A deacylase LpxR family protein [Fabibacter sp. E12]|nr:lipid A deacylase LpxR family protein [Roseivirga sp. E12]MBO3700177.1 lipid A deacylase LpxR family protein [Roseivirga sp. E12]
MNREFSITNDNDFYLLNDSDRYYSNGLIFHYRWSPERISTIDSTKRILSVGAAHRIFTPQDLLLFDFNDYHRPYAGLLSSEFSYSEYKTKSTRRLLGLEIGVTGSASGGQGFQEWYHNAVGFPAPRGWEYQIPSEFIVNLKGALNRQFILNPGSIDVISSTELSLGTGFTHALQRLDLRIGKLQSLRNSAFTNALIGQGSDQTPRHNYIFLGYGLQYVAHNITIDGSIWNDDAVHTETSQPWVRHLRLGFASSSNKATFKLTYNWSSPEVSNIGRHAYISLELLLRFSPKG